MGLFGKRGGAEPVETGVTREVELSDEEWRRRLTPEQYTVLRGHGTERAFTGRYWDAHEDGTYHCAACDAELFSSGTKFDSGTGWPSFWEPKNSENIELRDDHSLFMRRTEVLCRRCGSHLGHLFNDGPRPTGQRYCMNSVAMRHVPEGQTLELVRE